MAVAVKNTTETFSQRPVNRLAVDSLLGVVYILGCLGVVFYALPVLWWNVLHFPRNPVTAFALMLVMLGAAGGLIYLGLRLKGGSAPQGYHAGIFIGLMGILTIGFLTLAIGGILESLGVIPEPALGLGLMAVAGVALLIVAGRYYFRPAFEKRLVQIEEQGWFTLQSYKKSQGQRVRRGTILGILLLAGTGIFTMLNRSVLRGGDWAPKIPFTHEHLVLLPDVQYTLPFLLALASLWLAYRMVNFPTFADFLIATEAELNKVSWTTRKRLVQDTIVVLVTVVLLTVFLFVVDQIWAWILTNIGVIQIAPGGGGPGGVTKIPY